jgi:dTDP-4-dehydrorhamnose reductase
VLLSKETVTDGRLVIGADGLLGSTLRRYWRERGQSVFATSFLPLQDNFQAVHLDLEKPSAEWPELPKTQSAALCAAMTNLDYCRRNPTASRHINVTQTLALAERLVSQGTFVVFISSNLVFDGSVPFRKVADTHCPMIEYGRQKSDAEKALAKFGNRAAVIRLTKVVHPGLPLLRDWRDSLAQGKAITAFSDFVCSPIGLRPVIEALATIADRQVSGVWQLSGSADLSYSDMANHLAHKWGASSSLVQFASAGATQTIEHLPRNTTLDASAASGTLGFRILDPLSALDEALPA